MIRLVAEPTSYGVLTRLQRQGAATARELARGLDLAQATVEEHLRVLAEHELVRPAGDAWEALGTGLLVEVADDADGQEAVRLLTTRMFVEAAGLPAPWWTDDEPRLRARLAAGCRPDQRPPLDDDG